MKALFLSLVFALVGAALITIFSPPRPLDQQLLTLQVEQAAPEMADEVRDEPPEIQALLLSYADRPALLMKARLALMRYPDLARPVLLSLGDSEAFQGVLSRYGEDVVLPVHYFYTNEVMTLEFLRRLGDSAQSAMAAVRGLWAADPAGAAGAADAPAGGASQALTPDERAMYAVVFLEQEGYDFLGQFVVNARGDVAWVQTERVLEGLNQFFAGGIRSLESRVRRDEAVTAADVGWAAVDVAVGVGAFKVLRMGRTAAAGTGSLTFSQRSAVVGAGLWRGSTLGTRLVKYGAPAVLAYVAVRHPSVINSMLGSAAQAMGLPVQLVQFAGWTLLLLPVVWLLRLALRPLAWLVWGLARFLRGLDGLFRAAVAAGPKMRRR